MTPHSFAGRSPSFFPKPYADAVQRLRVSCGFVLLITFAWLSQPTAHSLLFGFPISLLGLGLRGWAGGHLAKNQELATSGPYGRIRNPLYLGTLITAAGIVVASRNGWLTAIFAAAFLLIYLPAVELEEQHLREIFPSYALYAASVRRFIPSAKYPGIRRPFSWALYRRNEEYKASLGFLVAFVWLLWKTFHL